MPSTSPDQARSDDDAKQKKRRRTDSTGTNDTSRDEINVDSEMHVDAAGRLPVPLSRTDSLVLEDPLEDEGAPDAQDGDTPKKVLRDAFLPTPLKHAKEANWNTTNTQKTILPPSNYYPHHLLKGKPAKRRVPKDLSLEEQQQRLLMSVLQQQAHHHYYQ